MRHLRLLLAFATAIVVPVATSASPCSFPSFDPASGDALLCDAADGRVTDVPYVDACRLADGETVVLDGILDDDIWSRAQAATGFRMWDPTRGADATEQTVFKIAYDDEAIYFGLACLESDASSITKPALPARQHDRQRPDRSIHRYAPRPHDRATTSGSTPMVCSATGTSTTTATWTPAGTPCGAPRRTLTTGVGTPRCASPSRASGTATAAT